MDAAAVVLRKPDARVVRPASENQTSSVGSDIRLFGDELLLRHSKKFRYAGYLRFGNADYPIRYATACAAPNALKRLQIIHGRHVSSNHLTTIVIGRDCTSNETATLSIAIAAAEETAVRRQRIMK